MDVRSLTYNSFSELRLSTGTDGASVTVLGQTNPGDGLGGTFYWDATSTAPDNNSTVIQRIGTITGRWIRLDTPGGGGGGGTYVPGPGIDIVGNVIANTAPDQVVTVEGQGATSVTGTYPNFTIESSLNLSDYVNDPGFLTAADLPPSSFQTLSWDETGHELSITDGNTIKITGFEPSFAKGNLIAGVNTTLTGTLTNRLVGSGDVVISVDLDDYLTLDALSATGPLQYNSTTGVFSITQASSTTDGYLSSDDWNTFNSKQDPLGFTPENVTNKVTDLTNPNNTTYPTTQAVVDAISNAGGGTVTSVSAAVPGSALNVTVTNATTTPNIAFTWGGTSSQYVTGTGQLASFPTPATPGDGKLSIITDTFVTGGGTFTANQSSDTTVSLGLAQSVKDAIDLGIQAYHWGDHALAGYEHTMNKVTNFTFINNTRYPTTQAVVDYINANTLPQETGNIIAGTGVSLTGSGVDRLVGSGNITISTTPPDLSGYVPETRIISIQGQAKDLSQDRSWSFTTSDIPEGSNLYFTTTRARESVSAGVGLSYDPLTGIFTNTAAGQVVNLTAGDNIVITGTFPNFTIAADLSDYYTKDDLQTSGDSEVHWDNITNTPSFLTLSSLSGTAPIVYNSTTGNISITQAGATSDGYLSEDDWNTFNDKADAFSTSDLIAGTGVTFTGSGVGRIIGTGNLTINATPVDLSAYVPKTTEISINGTTYDLSQNRSWTIPVADGSETHITPSVGITISGTGTSSNPYIISSPYQTLSYNDVFKELSISNGNSVIISGFVSSDVSITNSYGINIGGDLGTGLSIGLDTTVVDLRYLRKDVDDSNGANKLTLGSLEAGPTEITGTLTLGSVATGPMSNNFLTLDPATGEVEQTVLSVDIPELSIANGSGIPQFSVDLSTEDLKFVGTGDTSISFNAATNSIIINSVPGSGGGGAVTSFNGRDGAVVSVTGDYNTAQVTETTNLYFTQARVLSTVLTGLTLGYTAVTATDTVLEAFGKLQGQVSTKVDANRTLSIQGTAGRVVVGGGTQSLQANRAWTVDLATAGTAGTYTKVTTDAYGRVISGSELDAGDLPISAGTGIAISPSGEISNTLPDQVVTITGGGATSVSGTYPNFTITSTNTTYTAGDNITIASGVISAADTNLGITGSTGARTITSSTGTGAVIPLATTSISGLMSPTDKTKLDGLSNYVLPIASSTVLGGIKVGSGLAIDGTGVLSATASGTITQITAGNGMNFTTITSSGAVTLGTPSSITATSTNAVTATSHTHELAANSVVTAKILNSNVTFAKIQNIPTQTLMGRYSTGTGVVQSITLGDGLNLSTSGVLSATNTSAGTVTSVSSTVGGTALSVNVTNPTTTPNLAFDWEGTTGQYVTGAGTLVNFPSIPQGTVTSVAASIGGNAINVTGSPITSSGTLAFAFAGTSGQYINGLGNLVTFPSIPTVNNGTLNLATSGIATGSATFTANQSGNSTFTVNVPGTNLGSSLSGNSLTITSSTGTNTTVDLSSIAGVTPNLQQVTDVDMRTTNAIQVKGAGMTDPLDTNGILLEYEPSLTVANFKVDGNTILQGNASGTSLAHLPSSSGVTVGDGLGGYAQLIAGGAASLVLRADLNLGQFNTRVKGLSATEPDDFVTLSQLPDVSGFVSSTRSITAGNGLTGGGDLTTNRTITLGTPSSITSTSTNSVTSTSHTHELANGAVTYAKIQNIPTQTLLGRGAAGTGVVGAVTLGAGLSLSTAGVLTATGSGGTVTQVTAGNGMNFTTITGTGAVTLGTPGSITLSSTNSVSATSHTHAFAPGGTAAQYIDGTGALKAFPSTPTLQQVTTAGNTSTNSIAIGTSSAPTSPLTVQGANASTDPIAHFKTTVGGDIGVSISNRTPAPGTVLPMIRGYSNSSNYGLTIVGSGSTDAGGTEGRMTFRVVGADRSSSLTSGPAFKFQNGTTDILTLHATGPATFANLAGSGTRMVTAASDGTLNTQAIPDLTTYMEKTNTSNFASAATPVGGKFLIGTDGPTTANMHGLWIPHSTSAGYGSEIAMRNGSMHWRSLENGSWTSWRQGADQGWVASQIPTNYITTDTTQSGLTGNKTTSGLWDFTNRIQVGGFVSGTPSQPLWVGTTSGDEFARFLNPTSSSVSKGIGITTYNSSSSARHGAFVVNAESNIAGIGVGTGGANYPIGSTGSANMGMWVNVDNDLFSGRNMHVSNNLFVTNNAQVSGYAHFKFFNNNWYNDQDNNPRFYVGTTLNSNGFLFRFSQSTHTFQWRNTANTIMGFVSNSGEVNFATLSGTGTRMVVADAGGNLSTQPIPSGGGGVTSITIGNGLTGTSPITSTGTITLGTPGSITASSTNSVTASSHTHALANNAVTTPKIAHDNVTLAKLENLDQYEFIGRYSSGTGDPQKLKLGSGFNVNPTSGEVTGTGGWVDELGYEYEGNADNTAKGIDTRGGYATRAHVFLTDTVVPENVEVCIFAGTVGSATLTIPDPAQYPGRKLSIVYSGTKTLYLAGNRPYTNLGIGAQVPQLPMSGFMGPGSIVNFMTVLSVFNPNTSQYAWTVISV